MLTKLLASIGIGSARVNLEVAGTAVPLGGSLNGTIRIQGGNVEQRVDKIYINLILSSAYKAGDQTRNIRRTIGTVTVGEKMVVRPGEEKIYPVSFQIPFGLPISRGRTRYFLQTGLDIPQAIDPVDHDPIQIVPNREFKMFFDALRFLGFREKPGCGDYNGRFQEFEYRPTTYFARELDEIEVYPVAGERELVVVMQLDKKARGLFGSLFWTSWTWTKDLSGLPSPTVK
ncbi:sporulation protein [Desulfofundulus thermosubterraneus]|uniref:Sporulation-control protein n=1 Tax=Desulfofundulus thermosubterraneus DSM 16057 TaxID=1121432 RepID=A0A1M6ARB1_9FIRM|nr:sporulation protein [Desulfofundulus thermosubterraneus]SHI38858.1 sporulation-control protein [Desulfofundulus thermosubterraneus DSM 16057]